MWPIHAYCLAYKVEVHAVGPILTTVIFLKNNLVSLILQKECNTYAVHTCVWDAYEEILFVLIFDFCKNKFIMPVNLCFTCRNRKEKMKWTFL